MKSIIKFSLIAAAIGGLVYLVNAGKNQVSDWANKVAIKFNSIGKPQIKNGNITIPVAIDVTNPSPLAIPIDNISGKFFVFRNGMWQPFGNILPSGQITFVPGTTTQTFFPVIDIAKLNPINSVGAGIQAFTNLLNTGGQVTARIKIDVALVVKGFEVNQSIEQLLNLNDLLRAAA